MATRTIDAENCCIVPRGAWDNTTIYSPLDLVTHDGSSYIAVAENIGTEPTFYSPLWMLLAEKGDTAQLNPRGPWQKSAVYNPLDAVSYQGSSWIARRESIGRTPAENSFWMLLAERGVSVGGAQGAQGIPGPQGPQGPPGGGNGSDFQNLFVQPTPPVTSEPTYLWIQTGLGSGTDMTFWVEDDIP